MQRIGTVCQCAESRYFTFRSSVAAAPEQAIRLFEMVVGDEPRGEAPPGMALLSSIVLYRFENLVRICFPVSRADARATLSVIIGTPASLWDVSKAAEALERSCLDMSSDRAFDAEELLGFYRWIVAVSRVADSAPV